MEYVPNSNINQQHVVIVNPRKRKSKNIITKIKNIMKKFKSIFAFFAFVLLFTACTKQPPCTKICNNGGTVNSNCGCDCPNGYSGDACQIAPPPPPPAVPSCEKFHTATISFKNNSVLHYKYDIVWDGSTIATLSYQTVSKTFVVAKGTHTLKFKIHGTNTYGCTPSNPNLVECSSNVYSCSK